LQDVHVAAALKDVRDKLGAAGEGGDYSFEGDKKEGDAGGDVSGGLAALAAAMKANGAEEQDKKEEEKKETEGAAKQAEGPKRDELEAKSIKELREMCKTKGLDYSGCVDKHDLVDLIVSNPNATAVPAPAAVAQTPAAAMGLPANMNPAQFDQAKKMMENPAMMNNAVNMMKNMDPAVLANMFNMQHGTNTWTPEMAKAHIEAMQKPGVMEQAAQQMKNLSTEQMASYVQSGTAAANAAGVTMPPVQAAAPTRSAPPPASGRIDPDDVRTALSTPAPAPALSGAPMMNPQMQAQMEMMRNNPDMMKKSMEMMKGMDPEVMAKMLESQSAATGMKVTPEMAKMSAQMMKNMDPEQLEKMMTMAQGMGGGMGGMGGMGAHMGAAGGGGDQAAAAPGGAAGMPAMQMDPATGMPVVTPEMQKQMSTMMRDPEMRKNLSNMMKNIDPDTMKAMGITDKAQIEKAASVMEAMTPEQVDRLMGVAVWGQKAYIFYKTHLWFRCILQLTLMYFLYWAFGGIFMRTLAWMSGSPAPGSAAAAAVDAPAAAGGGGAVNAGESTKERDWSGKASAPVLDEDEVRIPSLASSFRFFSFLPICAFFVVAQSPSGLCLCLCLCSVSVVSETWHVCDAGGGCNISARKQARTPGQRRCHNRD
jgi:hypothetical protein